MMKTTQSMIIATMFLLFSGINGCDGGDGDGSAVVNEIAVDSTVLPLGTGGVLTVLFSFSAHDVFNDNRDIGLVVHLPRSLMYRNGTAEIKRPIDDNSVSPVVTVCAGGDSYLTFELGSNNLIDASNPDGDPDAELRLTFDAIRIKSGGAIDASALNDGVPFSCETGMAVQQKIIIDVAR